jgi:hypothetical protein
MTGAIQRVLLLRRHEVDKMIEGERKARIRENIECLLGGNPANQKDWGSWQAFQGNFL